MDHRYKKFLAVAETGSFSAAAKKLHVTQPAITLAIGSLERAFGVKLYTRKKYSVELTEQGKVVASAAKKINLEIFKMLQDLERHDNKTYNVGIIDTIAHLVYRSPEDNLLSNINVMVDNSKQIIAALLSDSIDIGVITGQPKSLGKELSVLRLHNEEFVFVSAPNTVSDKAVNCINDWLAVNKESTSYSHFTKLFKNIGLSVTPVFHSTSVELLKEMAIAGKGTALLPKHLVNESISNGLLAIVKTKPIYRPIWAVVKSSDNRQSNDDISVYIDNLLTSS